MDVSVTDPAARPGALSGASSNGIDLADASFGCTVDAATGSFRVPGYALACISHHVA